MEKKRKIEKVVRKVSFAEAETLDDEFWALKTESERLEALKELREIFFGRGTATDTHIAKVIFKRSIYDEGQEF